MNNVPMGWFIVYHRKRDTYTIEGSPDGERMYHNGGPGWCPFDHERYVVCWYLGIGQSWEVGLSAVRKTVDACKPVTMLSKGEVSCGYMDTQGNVYEAEGQNHSELARRLVARFYPDATEVPERVLESQRWITIHWGHSTHPNNPDMPSDEDGIDLTQAQLDSVDLIIKENPGNEYAEGLHKMLVVMGYISN